MEIRRKLLTTVEYVVSKNISHQDNFITMYIKIINTLMHVLQKIIIINVRVLIIIDTYNA